MRNEIMIIIRKRNEIVLEGKRPRDMKTKERKVCERNRQRNDKRQIQCLRARERETEI